VSRLRFQAIMWALATGVWAGQTGTIGGYAVVAAVAVWLCLTLGDAWDDE
jgi:hypothetical protein